MLLREEESGSDPGHVPSGRVGCRRSAADRGRGHAGRRRRGAPPGARGGGFRTATVVATAGDPSLVTYFRSSAKPIQALPVVRARPDLDDAEIAIACASHLARPEQLEPVRSLLAKAEATEDDLECGPEPTRLEHNCSGKHAGLIAALPRARLAGRGLPASRPPVPAGAARRGRCRGGGRPGTIPTAPDGCGIVTFGLSLERMAHAFSRLAGLEGGARVAAMQAHPDLIRGPLAADSLLMRRLPGWVAKGGAEGLLCASGARQARGRAQDRGRSDTRRPHRHRRLSRPPGTRHRRPR